MIAIGIPTYNEADNIANLVRKVDEFATQLTLPIIIINCDNNSKDGTSEIFRSLKTRHKRVALTTTSPGKGRNVREILTYQKNKNIPYCMLIDGDVTSLSTDWLRQHLAMANSGADYVVPDYARYIQEGNSTNHFAYPLLNHWTNGRSPRQPIAGDFGISLKLALYLSRVDWSEATLRYGVDIFMTMHALAQGFRVREIKLSKKIHKPSYGKMTRIIMDEAESYYEARSSLIFGKKIDFIGIKKRADLLNGSAISKEEIVTRISEAQALHGQLVKEGHAFTNNLPTTLDAEGWASILVGHDKLVGHWSPQVLARSITPYFLIRATSYLTSLTDPPAAAKTIRNQCKIIDHAYKAHVL